MKRFFLLMFIVVVSADHKIPWWNIKMAQEQGPNVCVVEEVPETNHKYYTECKYWRPRQICGRDTVIRYECCEGYQMVPGQLGCTGVKPLTDVVQTAKNAGAGKFANLLETTGVAEELKHGPAVTVFAPTDKAINEYTQLYGIRPAEFVGSQYRNLVLNHIADKRFPSSRWRADLLIESRLEGHKLRINKYSNGVQTVNCEEVIRKNQHATNGIVHVIDGVLNPALTRDMDIADIVMNDRRINILARIMGNSEIVKRLRGSQIPHTIFAPSDEAFQKISSSRLDKMLQDKETTEAIIANHIVAHPVCLPGVISEHRARTLGPEKLSLDCKMRGATVNDRRLSQEFVNGNNGLLYIIDDVILPDRAKTVLELAEQERLNAFTQLVRKAGLEDELLQFEPYTLFVPTEAAIYSMSRDELEDLAEDREKAKQFVLKHAALGRHTTDSIRDNQVIMSLDGKTPLRFQIYRGSVGIEDALFEKVDMVGSNGVLQIVNKILHPTTDSLDDVLKKDGNFSVWLKAMDKMREIQPETFEEFKRPETSYTYFVPSDEAFGKLGEAKLQRLMGDSKYLSRTLRNHVAEDMMATGGFKTDLQYAVRTKQNTVDVVRRNYTLKVNDAKLTKCDMLNRNGVAHAINKVLLPDQYHHYGKRKRGVRRAKRTHS